MNDPAPWTPPWVPSILAESTGAGDCVFLSDLHLGTGADQTARLADLDRLFETLPGHVDDLVLGGDIFEFWWEWKEAVPRRHLDFLLRLRELAAAGVRLRMIAGNHDFAAGRFLAEFLPACVHPDGFCLSFGGRRWLLVHGDGMAPSDRADRLVRRVLRSPAAQTLWNLLPPDLAFAVAGGVGGASRQLQPGPAPNIAEYAAIGGAWIDAFGLAGVVHGHTHRPLLAERASGTYVNNGDWVKDRSAVWIRRDGQARLVDCRKDGHPWRSNT